MATELSQALKSLPEEPGVYLMKNGRNEVIYVGKANSLKSRVSSYFQKSRDHSPRINLLVKNIESFDFIVTGTEMEALVLEFNLIKRHRPFFNVRFRDDKRYPLLEVTIDDRFPRFRIVRRKTGKKNRVFGPYTSTASLRQTITILKRVFQIRTCKEKSPHRLRPCLNYQIHQCSAPCAGYINPLQYNEKVKSAMHFLGGHSEHLLKDLKDEMERESEKLNYERCAYLLTCIRAIESVMQKSRMVLARDRDQDYIGFYEDERLCCAEVLIVREGKLIEESHYIFEAPEGTQSDEKARSFLMHYYGRGTAPPPVIYSAWALPDKGVIEKWLSNLAGAQVELLFKTRGKSRDLLTLASQNALHHFTWSLTKDLKQSALALATLTEFQQKLALPVLPMRIETYDISNISGKYAVGSMIVFHRGEPDKKNYRKFRIKGKESPDDVAMMREILRRRFELPPGDRVGEKGSWKKEMPDLIIIDGGKAQLAAGISVLHEKKIELPIISLAKKFEEIYLAPSKPALIIPEDSPVLHLLQRMRDESHRFAISYHRAIRGKAFLSLREDS
jgi:excinuclease ABC subunit C